MMFFLIVLAIVVGIRSVGVVLMAGMLIGPAVAARPLTNQLSYHFALAGLFGIRLWIFRQLSLRCSPARRIFSSDRTDDLDGLFSLLLLKSAASSSQRTDHPVCANAAV